MISMLIQFVVCMIATLAFSIVFCAPYKEIFFCGISGAIGWIAYLLVNGANGGDFPACLVGTFLLVIFSRVISVLRKTPVTVYLITGIFPLVPGAGIYYSSYNLIMNNMEAFGSYGMYTLKSAGGIVIGILLGMALPQAIFNKLRKIAK